MKKIGDIKGNAILVNLVALVIAIVLYFFVFKGLWQTDVPVWARGGGLIFLIILAVVIMFAHEGIHMLAANLFSNDAKAKLKIRLLTWECRLEGPLIRKEYIIYALAPAIILGMIGLIGHKISQSSDLRFISAIIFVIGLSGAGGDFWFVVKVLKYPSDSYIYDRGLDMEITVRDDE
jgi:hypothetical protein